MINGILAWSPLGARSNIRIVMSYGVGRYTVGALWAAACSSRKFSLGFHGSYDFVVG